MLITIEGIDGTGKSTLCAALAKSLQDLKPIFTREPGATWIGDTVRRAVAQHSDPVTEALLFVADHSAHISDVIRPALAQGKIVISDRYIDSRYAYQQVTLREIVPEPLGWLRSLHDGWTVIPDQTFLLVMPVDEALERLKAKNGREHFEQKRVLEDVQKNYLDLARSEPSRFIIIDATKEKEEITSFVAGAIRQISELSRSRHLK